MSMRDSRAIWGPPGGRGPCNGLRRLLFCTAPGLMDTGVREANGGDTPHEIRASATVDVFDPCTQRPRCGMWHITTYYTPVEGPLPGPREQAMQLRDGSVIHVHEGFRQEVWREGWGLLAPDHPVHEGLAPDHPDYADQYIGDPRPCAGAPGGFDYEIRESGPVGRNNIPLDEYISLATDQGYNWQTRRFDRDPVIALDGHAGFHMPPGNGWSGGSVCGHAVDHGPAIQGYDIDFYVGEHMFLGSGVPDAYDNEHGTDGPVSHEE